MWSLLDQDELILHQGLLNVIYVGWTESDMIKPNDNNNGFYLNSNVSKMGPIKYDHNKWLIKLTVITLNRLQN